MNKQYILSLIGVFCSIVLSYGQILTIVEKNGGRIDTVEVNSAQIIDVNGNLEIGISKTELINSIRSRYPAFGDQLDMQERIDALEKALTNQETLLERLKEQTLNTADKKAFYEELDNFYTVLLQDGNEDLRKQANDLFGEWRKLYGPRSNNPNSGLKKEVYILTNLNEDLNLATKKLANTNGKSFTVSMIAYVHGDQGKNRVHIENFDAISESEIYTVPRAVTTLSASQATKLLELKNRAGDYNQEAINYFASFKAELLSKLPDISCILSLKTDIQSFFDSANLTSDIKTAIKDDVLSLVAEIDGLTSLVSLVTQDISSWTIDTPFEIIAQTKTLAIRMDGVESIFNEFKSTSETLVDIKSQVDPLIVTFDGCYQTLSLEVDGLANAISVLKNQQDRFNDNDEISAEVTKFTLNDLPGTGYINLLRSGPRDKGDVLEIVLILRLPKTDEGVDPNGRPLAEKNETLESRLLSMQLIGLRSETAVGIIMGDSFNENGFIPLSDKRFLYTPVAALLLKTGSRNSKLYNDFIDFGFGLAVSTPDFNTDGTPEFGAGFMFTAFKDILSLGINYNVTLDTPYWSFGVNLPFNLPGIPINSSK